MAKTVNQKNVNFGTINKDSLGVLSDFNIARVEIDTENQLYRETMKELETKRNTIITDRDKAIKDGMTVDEVVAKFSTLEVDNKIRKEKVRHDDATKPLRESIKSAIGAFCTDELYDAYTNSVEKGVLAPYSEEITKFLEKLGVATPKKGTSKFAQIMAIRVNGRIKSNAKTFLSSVQYTKNRSKNQFNELFINEFLQYVVNDKKVVAWKDNGSLEMVKF